MAVTAAAGRGIAHPNARRGPSDPILASRARGCAGTRSAAVRGSDRTVMAPPSKARVTVPSRSVRKTWAPIARSRSSVERAGWPYGLPAPAEATAMAGRTASTNGSVVAVRLPWWATLRKSTRGNPAASSFGSMSCSTSPASRNRLAPTVPSSTIDTLLMSVPVSGGEAGTWPRIGHITRIVISSTAIRSPAATVECAGEPARPSRSSQAA